MKDGVRFWIGLGLMAAAGSCAGRNLPPEPDSYVAADAIGAERAAVLAASPATTWLDDMNSTEMSMFTREALAGSPELQIVEARYDAARWRARGAFGGNMLPSLRIGADAGREETPTLVDPRVRTRVDSIASSVIASWEIDLWGRLAAASLASDLTADAAEEDLNGARLSIAGQTATAWVRVLEAQQLLALAQEDLQTRERALDFAQRRYDVGISSSLDLRTARSQVASARGAEATAQDLVLVTSRRLQEIMGRYPDGALRAEGDLPQLSPIAAAGAPADLLERRPDVLAAEDRMRSAGFRIHEARAAMLPRLTLTGSAGSGAAGHDIDDVDHSLNMISNVVAGLTMPIFNGGALLAESRASVADRRAAASDYVRTSLLAWREVEGAISADQSLEVRETQFAIAAEEARAAQELAEREYSRGVATLFELIDAYTRRIDAERGLITARAARVNNRIAYHVALGGGARTGGIDDTREAAP
jgi:outer membrane protein, multidrug efflux system